MPTNDELLERISRLETQIAAYESRLAQIADCINQELRERHGDRFQFRDYLDGDFRGAIRNLVDVAVGWREKHDS